jgi:hypothetical protein
MEKLEQQFFLDMVSKCTSISDLETLKRFAEKEKWITSPEIQQILQEKMHSLKLKF